MHLTEYPGFHDKSNRQYTAEFVAWLGTKEIDTLTLMAWRQHLEKRYTAPASRNRAIAGVRPLLHWARLSKITQLSKDDIGDTLKAFAVPSKTPIILRGDALKGLVKGALLYNAPDAVMMRRFILFGLTTGARPGELVTMPGSDFDVVNQELKILASKTMRERRIPLRWSSSLKQLAPRVSTLGSFIRLGGPRGTPATANWRKVLLLGNVGFAMPKVMRSTAESHAASSGRVPLPWLRSWFGHSDAVSWHYYQCPLQGVTGDTLEQWFGCEAEMNALAAKVIEELA